MEEDINTDLFVLQSHLDGMIGRVNDNSLTLKKFQIFEMRLLKLNSLAEMVEHVLTDAKSLFGLDVISFCLVDRKGEIESYLLDDGYDFQSNIGLVLLRDKELLKSTFGVSSTPFLGAYKQSSCAGFFPQYKKKPVSVGIIPLIRRGKYLGSINFGSYVADRFIDYMATDFLQHMVSVVSICLENNLNFEMMRRTSLIDTLTGVNNRRFLEQRIDEELDRSKRSEEPLSCLFLDIDHFKIINDTYGHQAGDYVLSLIAGIIKKQLRSNDVLARYGGEEFVALLSNINETMVFDIAQRIRKSIKDRSFVYSEQKIAVTISIGCSTYQPTKFPKIKTGKIAIQLIYAADSALYAAKNNGRDKVNSCELVFDE